MGMDHSEQFAPGAWVRVLASRRLIAASLVFLMVEATSAGVISVYLQGGQSNGDGRAYTSGLPTSPVNLQAAQTNVDFYFTVAGSHPWKGAWIDLKPGSPEFNQTDYFGPEITFGYDMATSAATDPDRSVAIIKYARGSTSLYSHWLPSGTASRIGDGPSYLAFQDTVDAAMNALLSSRPTDSISIAGMIWMQGESDRHDPDDYCRRHQCPL